MLCIAIDECGNGEQYWIGVVHRLFSLDVIAAQVVFVPLSNLPSGKEPAGKEP